MGPGRSNLPDPVRLEGGVWQRDRRPGTRNELALASAGGLGLRVGSVASPLAWRSGTGPARPTGSKPGTVRAGEERAGGEGSRTPDGPLEDFQHARLARHDQSCRFHRNFHRSERQSAPPNGSGRCPRVSPATGFSVVGILHGPSKRPVRRLRSAAVVTATWRRSALASRRRSAISGRSGSRADGGGAAAHAGDGASVTGLGHHQARSRPGHLGLLLPEERARAPRSARGGQVAMAAP